MKTLTRNIIAFNLMLLIAFSSIGVNIVTTFCGGCNGDHISIAIIPISDKSSCSCCDHNASEFACCAVPEATDCEHQHDTFNLFAKLDIYSTEAKAADIKIEVPETIHVFCELANNAVVDVHFVNFIFDYRFVPFDTGREILTMHNVLLI